MCMVFILHDLRNGLDSIRNQILANPSVPTIEALIDCLLRVPSLDNTSRTNVQRYLDSSPRASNRESRCRVRGIGGRTTSNQQ